MQLVDELLDAALEDDGHLEGEVLFVLAEAAGDLEVVLVGGVYVEGVEVVEDAADVAGEVFKVLAGGEDVDEVLVGEEVEARAFEALVGQCCEEGVVALVEALVEVSEDREDVCK